MKVFAYYNQKLKRIFFWFPFINFYSSHLIYTYVKLYLVCPLFLDIECDTSLCINNIINFRNTIITVKIPQAKKKKRTPYSLENSNPALWPM